MVSSNVVISRKLYILADNSMQKSGWLALYANMLFSTKSKIGHQMIFNTMHCVSSETLNAY